MKKVSVKNRFTHLIITRFNLLEGPRFDKNGNPVQTEQWLKKRFELFEQFYLPSLASQTCNNFKAIVLFDQGTSEDYKQIINTFTQKYTFFKPYYVKDSEYHLGKIAQEYLELGAEYLLTTRLDNDDGLGRDAVAEIQKCFVPEHGLGINLYRGYRYLMQPHGCLLLRNSFINGPFISFIEDLQKGCPQTAYIYNHDEFFEKSKLIQIRSAYHWLQTIHESNLANTPSGCPVWGLQHLPEFAIDHKNIEYSKELFFIYLFRYIFNVKNYIPFKLKIAILKILGRR
jgi:hypothetical protein